LIKHNIYFQNLRNFDKNKIIAMETLVIHSKSKSNAWLLSTLARTLGDKVFENTEKVDITETHYASETALAKDWLTPEEDIAWKDL
jgi:hypothetical protein